MKQKPASMTISLTDDLREGVEKKLQRKGYSTASEYVRALIRKDLQQEAIEQVDALLLEGLNSGPAEPMTATDWKELHRMIDRNPSPRHATRKPRKHSGAPSRRAPRSR